MRGGREKGEGTAKRGRRKEAAKMKGYHVVRCCLFMFQLSKQVKLDAESYSRNE